MPSPKHIKGKTFFEQQFVLLFPDKTEIVLMFIYLSFLLKAKRKDRLHNTVQFTAKVILFIRCYGIVRVHFKKSLSSLSFTFFIIMAFVN